MDNDKPAVRHTAQQLKQYFLDNAEPLVKQYIDAALGTGTLASTNAGAREEVWHVLKQLMLQSSDKLDLNINNAEDILKAVSNGKCTFEEGDKLLSLYKKMSDIDNAGKLGVPGANNGVTVIIQGSAQSQQIQPTRVIEHED